jgi:hypothetical protein
MNALPGKFYCRIVNESGWLYRGESMKRLLAFVIASLLFAAAAFGQGSSLIWSAFSTGYQAGQGDSSVVEGMAGQVFAGYSAGGSSNIGGGFFSGYNATSVTLSISFQAGWNMISVPLSVSNYSKSVLFPSAGSNAFGFEGTYVVRTTLIRGAGYWIKFYSPAKIAFDGFTNLTDTIPVTRGWNLIGSVSRSIPAGSVASVPPGMVTSQFFGYTDSYQTSGTIETGKAYWVKVNGDGLLVLSSSGSPGTLNRIRIRAGQERPPAPPLSADTANSMPSVPREYSLGQNYPNPFNPRTHVHFSIANSGFVTLKVYDVLGREVATLVNETKVPGEYSVGWDASQMTSGVYFYHLDVREAGEMRVVYSRVLKMILIR